MDLNCHRPNAIYLIICCRCSLLYFAETVQKLNERFNLHKTGFKHPSKHGHQKILCDHFTKAFSKGAKYLVQITEKNGREWED